MSSLTNKGHGVFFPSDRDEINTVYKIYKWNPAMKNEEEEFALDIDKK